MNYFLYILENSFRVGKATENKEQTESATWDSERVPLSSNDNEVSWTKANGGFENCLKFLCSLDGTCG
jgi:hypothetical protein